MAYIRRYAVLKPYEQFWISLFKKNPCKKCLVKSACLEDCEERRRYNTALGEYPFYNRILSWLIVFVVFIEVPIVILSSVLK